MQKDPKVLATCGLPEGKHDHSCLGASKAHPGMWVTVSVGSDSRPYRMVWVSSSGRQAVVMRDEHLTGRTKLSYRRPGLMIRQGADGKWWEEGPQHAGKQPIKLGIGIEFIDPSF